MRRLQPCPVLQHYLVCFFVRPAFPLVHQKRMIRCTFACGMLLQIVEEIDPVAFLCNGQIKMCTSKTFDESQVII